MAHRHNVTLAPVQGIKLAMASAEKVLGASISRCHANAVVLSNFLPALALLLSVNDHTLVCGKSIDLL